MPTFLQIEASREGSRPVDLYRFDFGAEIFRFTNSEDDITFGGATYTAISIRRGSPTVNPREMRSQKMKITTAASRRPFADFSGIQPALKLTCIITRIQLDEYQAGDVSPQYQSPLPTIEPTTGFVIFEGYVSSVVFEGRTCSVELNPNTEQFLREVPRYKYQSLCNHVLYDSECQVNRLDNDQVGLVTGLTGNTVTLNGFTGSEFTGGYLQDASGTDFRMIIEQDEDVFTMLLPFSSDVLGTNLTAFKGCAHDVTTCRDKFNNVNNFGGFPFVPTKNPFAKNAFAKVDAQDGSSGKQSVFGFPIEGGGGG